MKLKDLFSWLSMAIIAGLVWAAIISWNPIAENRYLQYGMSRLAAVIFQRNANIAVFISIAVLLILYFAFFIAVNKMKMDRNGVINFLITSGILLSGRWFLDVFSESALSAKLRAFFLAVRSILNEGGNYGRLLSLFKTHVLAIVILVSCLVGVSVLFCLVFKLKWDNVKIPNLLKGQRLRQAGLVAVILLFILNVAAFVGGKLCPDGPNVILIVVDAWRADSLGCYDEMDGVTPNIDRFSETAVLFKNPVAQGSNTFNTAPSIFASVYPSEHRYFNYSCRVSDRFNTIAEFLKNQNYKTLGISTNPHVSTRRGLGQGFDVFVEDTIWEDTNCDEINEKFIKWLEVNKHKKFFAMLWYIDPHSPYEPPRAYIDKYITTAEEKKNLTNKAKNKAGKRPGPITEIEKEVARKLYKGEVNFFDTEFRELMDYLESSGLTKNSMIILTADHGESFWDKTFMGKSIRGHGGSLYEEEIKIPLIISLPSQKQGKVITQKVQQIDLLPTILEYTSPGSNVTDSPFLRGNGLRALIEGEKQERKYCFSELIDTRKDCPTYHMECIQTDDFKVIKAFQFNGTSYAPPDIQLFSLRPTESRCDVNDENVRPLFDELRRKLLLWHKTVAQDAEQQANKSKKAADAAKKQEDNETQDELLKQRLKSLGYVQ